MMTDSDEALVRGAQGGDRSAFEEMVRRTSRLVYSRLFQETLLSAFRSLGELADPKGFRPWLLKIAQNVVLDAARYESRKKRAGPARGDAAVLHTLADKQPSPEDQVARQELRGQVLAIL